MKRFVWMMAMAALLTAAITGCAAAEGDFDAWLKEAPEWQGWTAASLDQWEDWGAALLTRPAGFGDLTWGYALCVAQRQESGWETVPRDFYHLLIIGVRGDDWYIVWDWSTGRTGRIRVIDNWEGNG